MAFRDILQALRDAAGETGLQESPQAQDSPQGFPRRHRGYRVIIGEVGGSGSLSDRSSALLRYRLTLKVSHRLRPTPGDGFDDLAQAGSDYESLIAALMGDATLNGQGLLALGKFAPKLSKSGEWIEAPLTFTVDSEFGWLLDGGQETGS